MENKEKEIYNTSSTQKKKLDTLKKDYTITQKNLLGDLFKKIIKSIMPIEFKIFSHKYIKLNDIEYGDSLEKIISKIDENIEM
jgi:hypothetical protein